jgi:hypothetical protein
MIVIALRLQVVWMIVIIIIIGGGMILSMAGVRAAEEGGDRVTTGGIIKGSIPMAITMG